MYDSVRNYFIEFTNKFEGTVEWMYLDIKGLVTIGIGNLIDPVDLAVGLPYVKRDDESTSATDDEVRAEWQLIKGHTELAQQGYRSAGKIATLKMKSDDITTLVMSKLDANYNSLKRTTEFASLDDWPADAQLALLSMAWGLGSGFGGGWPNFRGCAGNRDWAGCGANCKISEAGNPGVAPRNVADLQLFNSADVVEKAGADKSKLWYPDSPPSDLSADGGAQQTQQSDGGTTDGGGESSTPDGG